VHVALINTNRISPPIAPIGLEYVAEALAAACHQPLVLDLCWSEDWRPALAGFFAHAQPGLVGLTLRNTDDCALSSRQSFLGEFAEIVRAARSHTDALLVAGGAGFSTLPEQVLAQSDVDAGVWGDGEFALVVLADRLAAGQAWRDLPNLLWREGAQVRRNPPAFRDLSELPPMRRSWFDNPRYFTEGGQAGFESKRGCPGACIYCADPVAKGRQVRCRPPVAVADEIASLLAQGIDHLHTCDCEFNLPPEHATAVCEELTRRGLGERLRWYAYCAPAPFSRELAGAMRRAGCVGINFGADSGDAAMLRRLGRSYTPEEIASTVGWCREQGIVVMLDLLIGGPGETPATITRTLELMKRVNADRVGVSLGLRVYPGTRFAAEVAAGEHAAGLLERPGPEAPLFFLAPEIAPSAGDLIGRLTDGDPRFLFFDPSRPQSNYNYNANAVLVEAIRKGYRGAYWDILRRCQ